MKKSSTQKQKLRLRKIFISTLITMLLFNLIPGASQMALGSFSNQLDRTVHATSLADVQLLTDVSIGAQLIEQEAAHYNLELNMTGTGLADVELLTPDRLGVFYIPKLAGEMTADGKADVSVEILPIKMEDLPALNAAVGNLTGTVTDLVTGLTTGLDAAINGTLLAGVVKVNGLTELNRALDNLNNLDQALADLLAYEDQIDVLVNSDGSIVIDFSDGLGNHVETAVKSVVTDTVTGVLDAVEGLDIQLLSVLPGLGTLLNSIVINPLVNPLKSAVVNAANAILVGLTDGTIDLTADLAGLQVIGETEIDADVKVDKPAMVTGEVDVYGAGVRTSLINLPLLSSLTSKDIIIFDEEVFLLNPPEVDQPIEGEEIVTGTGEPGATVVVRDKKKEIGTAIVAEDGTYTVSVRELIKKEKLSITQFKKNSQGTTYESNPTKVTVQADPGKLTFKSAPKKLLFNVKVTPTKKEYLVDLNELGHGLVIKDNRVDKDKWELSAKMEKQLKDKADETNIIYDALIYRGEDGKVRLGSEASVVKTQIYTESSTEKEVFDLSADWGENGHGLFIEITPEIKVAEYEGIVKWTLNDAP